MDDKDKKLHSKLEGLFSDLPAATQAEPAPGAPPVEAPRAPGDQATEEPLAVLRTVAEHTFDAIAVSDVAGRLIYCNHACYALFGYDETRQELINLPADTLWPDEQKHWLTNEILPQAMAGRTAWQGEAMQRRKDGSFFNAALTLSSIRDAQGQLVGRAAIVRDLTERQAALETDAEATSSIENDLLRTLIDTLPDLIYVKDTESRFLVANMAEARLMGAATPGELLGKSDADYFPAELADKYRADEQAILQSGQPMLNYEEPTVDLDGNPKWLINSKVPVRDRQGKVIGLVGMGRDITERKQAEAERERLAQDIQARAERDQTISGMIARVRAGLTVEQVLNATVQEIGTALGAARVAVQIKSASGDLSGALGSGQGNGTVHQLGGS
jgi:PAS domain S-box-containing protein